MTSNSNAKGGGEGQVWLSHLSFQIERNLAFVESLASREPCLPNEHAQIPTVSDSSDLVCFNYKDVRMTSMTNEHNTYDPTIPPRAWWPSSSTIGALRDKRPEPAARYIRSEIDAGLVRGEPLIRTSLQPYVLRQRNVLDRERLLTLTQDRAETKSRSMRSVHCALGCVVPSSHAPGCNEYDFDCISGHLNSGRYYHCL
ncbi:hypothetical protein CC2G_006930 [Coprinopsis cinerea AmutBmut pab1-1]|nr:hypothetical protein CC2G_006930 [Coprinopsis cinerea AmutBmut pab1-1]